VSTIRDVAGQELAWVQPARTHQAFELHAGDEVVASLRFERSSLAIGEADTHRWSFKREGFWHPRVTVRLPDSDDNAALFQPSWAGGGTLELPGRILRFGAANFWHSQWDWQDSDNKALVHFKSHHGFLKTEGQVEIEPDATGLPELSLLVVLGWYLLVLFGRDAASAGAAGAAAAAATG
jgi:hypothetical protein